MKLFIAQLRKIAKWVSLQGYAGAACVSIMWLASFGHCAVLCNYVGCLAARVHTHVPCQQHRVCTCSHVSHASSTTAIASFRLEDEYSKVENVRGKKTPLIRPVVSETLGEDWWMWSSVTLCLCCGSDTF
jgi:hypothetical protein